MNHWKFWLSVPVILAIMAVIAPPAAAQYVGTMSCTSTPPAGLPNPYLGTVTCNGVTGGVEITTVSGLASISGKTAGTIAVVTNGNSATDCTAGGGTTIVTCQYSGSAWADLISAGTMIYPEAGIPLSVSGTSWGTSLTKFGSEAGISTSADPGATAEVPMVADGTHGQKPSASGALNTGAFAAVYSLPTATSSVLGGVKPDGTTLTNSTGAISVTYGTSSNTAAQGNDSRLSPVHSITIPVSGSPIATGQSSVGAPSGAYFSCTINKVSTVSPVSGSITVDIWKANAAIPTSGNKISASAPASLSSATLNASGSLTGWTTSVSSGDVFWATVASVDGILTQATIQLGCQ